MTVPPDQVDHKEPGGRRCPQHQKHTYPPQWCSIKWQPSARAHTAETERPSVEAAPAPGGTEACGGWLVFSETASQHVGPRRAAFIGGYIRPDATEGLLAVPPKVAGYSPGLADAVRHYGQPYVQEQMDNVTGDPDQYGRAIITRACSYRHNCTSYRFPSCLPGQEAQYIHDRWMDRQFPWT